tara:strand:+ start:118 stop:579 length:462 start_codon:yes stop_codon:yes gene_type:complete
MELIKQYVDIIYYDKTKKQKQRACKTLNNNEPNNYYNAMYKLWLNNHKDYESMDNEDYKFNPNNNKIKEFIKYTLLNTDPKYEMIFEEKEEGEEKENKDYIYTRKYKFIKEIEGGKDTISIRNILLYDKMRQIQTNRRFSKKLKNTRLLDNYK